MQGIINKLIINVALKLESDKYYETKLFLKNDIYYETESVANLKLTIKSSIIQFIILLIVMPSPSIREKRVAK